MINKYFKLGKNILFPINRSITGVGIVKTLKIIKKIHPKLKLKFFKTDKKRNNTFLPVKIVCP